MEWRSLINWPWKRQKLLDYLRGSVQSEGTLQVEEGSRTARVRGLWQEKDTTLRCWLPSWRKGTMRQRMRADSRSHIKQERDFYPEPTEIAITLKTPLYWPGGKCIHTWILHRISGSSQTPWWMQRHPWPPGLLSKSICLSPLLSWNTWCWILPSTGTSEAKCGTGWSVWDRGLKIKVCWGPTLSQASW